LVWIAGQQRESRGHFGWVIDCGYNLEVSSSHDYCGSGYNVEVRSRFNILGWNTREIFQDCHDPSAGRRRR
jgi:hypothetical protein